jgi:hypothetical protein
VAATPCERNHFDGSSYEVASAAFQIAIVLASSTVITGVLLLTYLAGGLGVIGLAFLAIGLLAPHSMHLFRRSSARRRRGSANGLCAPQHVLAPDTSS